MVPPPDATVTPDPSILLMEALYSLQFGAVTGDPVTAMAEVKGTIPGGGTAVPTGLVETRHRLGRGRDGVAGGGGRVSS